MVVSKFSRRRLIELDKEWRAVYGRKDFYERRDPEALEAYQLAFHGGELYFATQDFSQGGSVTLAVSEAKPDPQTLCEDLAIQDVFLFPPDLEWCLAAGHEDWDRIGYATRTADKA
jgi:hypothetical protein